MKNSGKPSSKGNKPAQNKNLNRGNQKPQKAQRIIKPTVRGR